MSRWETAATFRAKVAYFLAALGIGFIVGAAVMFLVIVGVEAVSGNDVGIRKIIQYLILVPIFAAGIAMPPAAVWLLLLLCLRLRSLVLYVLAGILAGATIPIYLVVSSAGAARGEFSTAGALQLGLLLAPGAVAGFAVHSFLFQRWTLRL